MAITVAEVEYVAKLAKLDIPAEARPRMAEKMSALLAEMSLLNELDTEGVAPTSHVLLLDNVFREDETKPCLTNELALANAPESEQGYFVVPSIL